jgi:hypothetical protein
VLRRKARVENVKRMVLKEMLAELADYDGIECGNCKDKHTREFFVITIIVVVVVVVVWMFKTQEVASYKTKIVYSLIVDRTRASGRSAEDEAW